MPHPKINPAVHLTPVAKGYLGWNAEAERLHELPPLGGLAAELCDGSRTEEEIAAVVAPLISENAQEALAEWFSDGYASGLLLDCDPAPPQWLSAAELHELADKLARQDRYELAIEVQEKATERNPGEAGYWNQLGWLRQTSGDRKKAAEAFEQYLELQPDDAYTRHRLIALKDEDAPERASDLSMVQEFDGFSAHYDEKMRQRLGNEAPERMTGLLWNAVGDAKELAILDIGCGTGLVGELLKPRAGFLAGIDLSPGMLEKAKERGIYDLLEEAEVVAWLENEGSSFDLAVSCDCFVYFGDLSRVVKGVAKRLKPGGVFGFSVERGEEYPHKLMMTGRYTHTEKHVHEAAADAGLEVMETREGFLRYEAGVEVMGIYTVLRKPPI